MGKSIRREMKRRAAANMRAHYLVFMFARLAAAMLGARFQGSLEFLNAGSQRIGEISEFPNRFGREGFATRGRGVLAAAVMLFLIFVVTYLRTFCVEQIVWHYLSENRGDRWGF